MKQNLLYHSDRQITLAIQLDYSKLLQSWETYRALDFNYRTVTEFERVTFDLIKQKETKINRLLSIIFRGRRVKRGLFNFIGDVISEITGNLSHEEGEKIEQQILELYNNQKVLSENPSEIFRVINETVNNLTNQLNEHVKLLNDYVNTTIYKAKLADQSQYQLWFVDSMLEQLDQLLLALTLMQSHILYPDLIEPVELLNVLKSIKISDSYRIPYELTTENLLSTEALIEVKYTIRETAVLIVLQVPLISDNIYVHYHLFSVPMVLNDNQVSTIDINYNEVGINDNRYVIPKNCKMFQENIICKNLVEYGIIRDTPCEIKIISNYRDLSNCVKEIRSIESFRVLYIQNVIFLILPKTINIQENCNALRKNLFVQGTYYIKPTDHCTYTINNTLVKNVYKNIKLESFEFITYGKFLHDNINNLTFPKFSNAHVRNEIAISKLEKLSFKNKWLTHSSIILLVVIALIIIILLLYISKKLFLSKCNRAAHNNDVSLRVIDQ